MADRVSWLPLPHLPFQSHGQLTHCTTHSPGREKAGAERGSHCPVLHRESVEGWMCSSGHLLLGQGSFCTPFLGYLSRMRWTTPAGRNGPQLWTLLPQHPGPRVLLWLSVCGPGAGPYPIPTTFLFCVHQQQLSNTHPSQANFRTLPFPSVVFLMLYL